MAFGFGDPAGQRALAPAPSDLVLGRLIADRPSVRWVASAAEYAVAVEAPREMALPVLRPADSVASRWERVLREHYGEPAATSPATCFVIGWSAASEPAAGLYARRTQSRLVACDALSDVVAAIESCRERHIVVVALAEYLAVSDVAQLSAVARHLDKTVGFLTGRDTARLSFSVAKALLRPQAELTAVQVFVAPMHQLAPSDATSREELMRSLERPALAKLLRSHGEGGHAKFPGIVACGVLDDVEFPDAPAVGCGREPRRCKRAARAGAQVVGGDELRAAILCFVCCNGFNVAGELYPSPVSLVLSFAEGWAAAVIAPLRPLIAPDELVEELYRGLLGGVPLGELVNRLNALSEELGDPNAFVLLGDPCASVPTRSSVPVPRPPESHMADDLADLQAWLVSLLQGAERGRRVLRAARAWLGRAPHDLLNPLEQRLGSLEGLLVNTLKWAQTKPSGPSRRRLLESTKLIRVGVSRCDDGIALLLLESRATLDPFDIGHYDQIVDHVAVGAPCPRCRTQTEVQHFGRGEPGQNGREARMCWVCGPVSESRRQGLSLSVEELPATATAGAAIPMRIRLRAATERSRFSGHIHLRLRCFDKANDLVVHEDAMILPNKDQVLATSMQLTKEVGLDLHSVRVVAVNSFDVAYGRGRFACLPRLAKLAPC